MLSQQGRTLWSKGIWLSFWSPSANTSYLATLEGCPLPNLKVGRHGNSLPHLLAEDAVVGALALEYLDPSLTLHDPSWCLNGPQPLTSTPSAAEADG